MCCPSIRFVESESFALFDRGSQSSKRSRVETGLWPLLCPITTRRGYQGWPAICEGSSVRFPTVGSCSEGGVRIRALRFFVLRGRRESRDRDERANRILSREIWSRKMRAEPRRVPVAFQVRGS